MKSVIKIGFIVLVIAGLGVLVRSWYRQVPPLPQPPPPPDNPFVCKTENSIDSLSHYSEIAFCNTLYRDIKAEIRSYSRNNKIDSTDEVYLLKNLDYNYFDKFIFQAFQVFDDSEWDDDKRQIIASEATALKHSPYLESGSVVSKKLDEIQAIIRKYNEVSAFIGELNNYLDYSPFNLDNSRNYVTNAADWERRGFDNRYVNNITKFHNSLHSVPSRAYSKHLNYVKSKVNANRGRYRTGSFSGNNWAQQAADYRDRIFDPIVNELIQFQNTSGTLYGISAVSDLQNVRAGWNNELFDAIEYFKKFE